MITTLRSIIAGYACTVITLVISALEPNQDVTPAYRAHITTHPEER